MRILTYVSDDAPARMRVAGRILMPDGKCLPVLHIGADEAEVRDKLTAFYAAESERVRKRLGPPVKKSASASDAPLDQNEVRTKAPPSTAEKIGQSEGCDEDDLIG